MNSAGVASKLKVKGRPMNRDEREAHIKELAKPLIEFLNEQEDVTITQYGAVVWHWDTEAPYQWKNEVSMAHPDPPGSPGDRGHVGHAGHKL